MFLTSICLSSLEDVFLLFTSVCLCAHVCIQKEHQDRRHCTDSFLYAFQRSESRVMTMPLSMSKPHFKRSKKRARTRSLSAR
jgi:hypothetical protein